MNCWIQSILVNIKNDSVFSSWIGLDDSMYIFDREMIFVRFGFYYFFEYIFNNLNLMDSIIYRRYDIYLVKVENGPKIK